MCRRIYLPLIFGSENLVEKKFVYLRRKEEKKK